jgi:hypothetical protein
MTIHEGSELLRRVERYDTAVQELEAAHEAVKDILNEAILFDRWQRLGAQFGFEAQPPGRLPEEPNRDLQQLNQQISAMSESWAH